MPTIERARRIAKGMGRNYVIVRDERHDCYRVLPSSDSRVGYVYPLIERQT